MLGRCSKILLALLLLANVAVLVLVCSYHNVITGPITPRITGTVPRYVAANQGAWRFIVSGDSRNCGDVVMPSIATHSARYAPGFYWHLGDLRAIYKTMRIWKQQLQRMVRY